MAEGGGRRRLWRVLAAALVLTAVALPVVSRARFGTFVFWGLPDRIEYCGRRYYSSPPDVQGTPRTFMDQTSGDPDWKVVKHTLTWRAIGAAVPRHRAGSVCTMVLYIRTGDRRYRAYDLSGGP